jgi:hypothetical protein
VKVNNEIKIYIFCSASWNLKSAQSRRVFWMKFRYEKDWIVWNKYDERTAVRNCVPVPGAEMWRTRICCCSSLSIETKERRGWRVSNCYWATNHRISIAFSPKSQLVSFFIMWCHDSILCHISPRISQFLQYYFSRKFKTVF